MRARSLITNRGRGVGGEVKADEATILEAIQRMGVALAVHAKQNKTKKCCAVCCAYRPRRMSQ